MAADQRMTPNSSEAQSSPSTPVHRSDAERARIMFDHKDSQAPTEKSVNVAEARRQQKIATLFDHPTSRAGTAPLSVPSERDTKWIAELQGDPETLRAAQDAIRSYGGDDGGAAIAQELADAGVGFHPGLVRLLARAWQGRAK